MFCFLPVLRSFRHQKKTKDADDDDDKITKDVVLLFRAANIIQNEINQRLNCEQCVSASAPARPFVNCALKDGTFATGTVESRAISRVT